MLISQKLVVSNGNVKKNRILFSSQEKEWNSNLSLFQPHKMQTIAGLATHPLIKESRRDHCAVLLLFKSSFNQ